MYHLGMNVAGENEDSRQSFQSVTDSEISESNIRKSPVEPSQIVINESPGSFSLTASSGNQSNSYNMVCCSFQFVDVERYNKLLEF